MVSDGHVKAEAADQLQGSQAGDVFVASQPALKKLFVHEQEDGPVPTRDVHCHPERLHLWIWTGEEMERETTMQSDIQHNLQDHFLFFFF